MAGERALPGLGLRAYWTVGSNNWDQQHDPDTRKLSVLVQAAVKSRTTNLPTGSNGDIYIVPVGQTNENQIAAKDNGAWVYFAPAEGFLVHVNDDDEFVKWTGSAWEALATGGGGGATELTIVNKTASYSLTTAEAGAYVRMNVASANNLTVPTNASQAIPVGAVIQVRQVGAGQTTLVAASGVTINTPETLKLRAQGSSASLVKVGTNEWDLTGDLELAA
jgi:hypothetical protein